MNTDIPANNKPSLKTRISTILKHEGFQKYSKNVSWSLIGRFTTMAISFFVSAFVARYLGPSNYGLLSYAVSFVGIFTFISSLGIETILFRSLIEHPEKRAVLMGTALRLKLVAGFGAMLIALIISSILKENDISFILISILSLTYILNSWQIISFEFQADVQLKIPSIISLIIAIILNCLKLLVVFMDKGVLYLCGVLVLESVLYAIIFIFSRKKEYGSIKEWRYDKSEAISMLKESWPLIFSTGFILIYSRIDQIILKHFLDTTAVGLYDSAVRLAETWYIIPGLIISALFPAIVNSRKVSWQTFKKRTIYLTLSVGGLSLLASIFIQIFAPFIIHLLYGNEFLGNITVLRVYMWSGIWTSIGLVVHHLLIISRSTKLLAATNLGAMILNVVLNIILIPHYGINGAAIATSISYVILAIPILFILRKEQVLTPDAIGEL